MSVAQRRIGCLSALGAVVAVGLSVAYWWIALPVVATAIALCVLVSRHRASEIQTQTDVLSRIYRLAPADFEKYVAAMLKSQGWTQVHWAGKSGDLGADVIGFDPQGRKCVVQAKRYALSATIGSPVVQALLGSQQIHNADRSVLVTTGKFTPAAIDLAEMMDVELVDGSMLIERVRA